MFCLNCGNKIEKDHEFCTTCGKTTKVEIATKTHRKLGRNKKVFSIVFVSILAIGALGYLAVYTKNHSQKIANLTKSTLSNAEIVNKVKPATVYIETDAGAGSGMIIDENGYILTNAHVVYDTQTAKVKLSDGKVFTASVIGRDENIDLAVLKIDGNSFPKVTFANSNDVIQGDDVFTMGYPFGLEGDVSFKEGTISRTISDKSATYLETSAEIHPGNSGGPLVNKYGEVIGINTAALGNSLKGITIGETIKLAIPANIAVSIIPDLEKGRNVVIKHEKPKAVVSSNSPGNSNSNQGGNSTATTFAMKAQCETYKNKIKDEISLFNFNNKKYSKIPMTEIFDEIFYSPVTNSCLYTMTLHTDDSWWLDEDKDLAAKMGIDKDHYIGTTYFIRDYLEDNNVFTVVSLPNESESGRANNLKKFQEEINYYKGK